MQKEIDWKSFSETPLFKKGNILLNLQTRELHDHMRNVAVFDTSFLTQQNLFYLQNKMSEPPLTQGFFPSLFANLMYLPMDEKIKTEIIEQWIAVSTTLNKIESNPIMSLLIIGEKNERVNKHSHSQNNKQILTFQFEYNKELNDQQRSSIYLHQNDDIITHKLTSSNSDKTFFTIIDNCPHSAIFSNLTFCWVYDFAEYIDINQIKNSQFEYLTFIKCN